MELLKLEKKSFQDSKSHRCHNHLVRLNDILQTKQLSDETISQLNKEFKIIVHDSNKPPKEFRKTLHKKTYSIFKIIEKNHKLVPKNYYRNQWLALGMAMFGVPFGMMFGLALDNLAFLGIGLPIGMSIGIAIGDSKDKEAEKNGLQLDITYH